MSMKEAAVVIVGAGPAGLVLALSLTKYNIHSIILEKEPDITDDPRGVYLAGDAIRILSDIGIGEHLTTIGHQVESVNFHRSTFQNPPFFTLHTTRDYLNQALSDGILQIQPKLEYFLRCAIEKSPYCELRCSSNVVSREELHEGLIVGYRDGSDSLKHIKCSWLVGADGKKGVVRKHFLEPTANIKQEVGLYSYTGTWVAANLKIHLPTQETHPGFPLWELGFSPERVYDFFWPAGWHFCSPPGKATATGRFGTVADRFWRHEFAEPNWNDSMDPVALLWQHLLPMITRSQDELGKVFPDGNVTFPLDCIEIRRCRPFTFCQKVVNKWFNNRIVLIGDAAHVFPPFGGQGIACGIRDAHALAWRLALLLRMPHVNKSVSDNVLTAWALERRQGVDDSTRLTMENGKLTNEPLTLGVSLSLRLISAISRIPFLPHTTSPSQSREQAGYKPTKGGFFLSEYGGGGKLAQIYVQSPTQKPFLSDGLLKRQTAMTLLIVGTDDPEQEAAKVTPIIRAVGVHSSILSEKSFLFLSAYQKKPRKSNGAGSQSLEVFYPVPEKEIDRKVRPGYDVGSYMRRIRSSSKYAIIRPDYIIFAVAKSTSELEQCLWLLKGRLGQGDAFKQSYT